MEQQASPCNPDQSCHNVVYGEMRNAFVLCQIAGEQVAAQTI